MSSSSCVRFLVINGDVIQTQVPQVSTFLETNPGAYTTTRTHNAASCILFWDRHMRRIAQSATILANSRPEFFFGLSKSCPFNSFFASSSSWESVMRPLVSDALRKVMTISMNKRGGGEELAITSLVSGNVSNLDSIVEGDTEETRISKAINVCVHVGTYVPLVFGVKENGARLAVVGHGREVARAKFSEWVTMRKSLEKLRPPLTNELLLSNDGDQILEGCLTNFFAVCCKEKTDVTEQYLSDSKSGYSFEVQTAPLSDGVLPGVIRQLVIEVCQSRGIPFREVAPCWSQRKLWNEAFITNSLRVVQHVEKIQVPSSWELIEMKTWKEVNWEEICFKECPGVITSEIQKEIGRRADLEGYPISNFT
ncbi:hypothetical protein IFM89_028337 [Coptis chinensis]|uniref:Uncharacterized protein n=1 Tax=Coptis chinensis TaxID=261450 RepID=A0A835IBU4_9MAGN|nr:hypothetical protein IFM89_028337 [Coptis chinensis]